MSPALLVSHGNQAALQRRLTSGLVSVQSLPCSVLTGSGLWDTAEDGGTWDAAVEPSAIASLKWEPWQGRLHRHRSPRALPSPLGLVCVFRNAPCT